MTTLAAEKRFASAVPLQNRSDSVSARTDYSNILLADSSKVAVVVAFCVSCKMRHVSRK